MHIRVSLDAFEAFARSWPALGEPGRGGLRLDLDDSTGDLDDIQGDANLDPSGAVALVADYQAEFKAYRRSAEYELKNVKKALRLLPGLNSAQEWIRLDVVSSILQARSRHRKTA